MGGWTIRCSITDVRCIVLLHVEGLRSVCLFDRRHRSSGRANVCAVMVVVVTGGGNGMLSRWLRVRSQNRPAHTHTRAHTHAHRPQGTRRPLYVVGMADRSIYAAHPGGLLYSTYGLMELLRNPRLAQLPRHHRPTFFILPSMAMSSAHVPWTRTHGAISCLWEGEEGHELATVWL